MSGEPAQPSPRRERDLFFAALDITDAGKRAAFLDRECGGDRALRNRVDELLREHESPGSFMEKPAVVTPVPRSEVGSTMEITTSMTVTEKAGDRIGYYKVLQQIGEGGCGVVYMAEQEKPVRRRVALKVIKLGMDTKSVIARFEAERQALAMMDHPNIAKVLDAGATEAGRPYFVMELVRGIRITDYCDQNNLSTAERLELFVLVCNAIQHAHQKGIIHRDIKPSNILVTLHDGKPVPKVIDFGIAKATEQRLTDKTLFTEFQAFIGTPAYMSPEQAEMSGLDIDTRSDIYSLGVLLYQLLTGKTPFDAETLMRAGLEECRRTIREDEPVRPSSRVETMVDAELTTTARQRHTEAVRLVNILRGDLDWIVMRSLEKDRTRRYATANDLAEDVHRYLHSEAVLARPPSNVYRFQKFVRRHRGAFAAGVAIAFTLLAGVGLSLGQAVRATRAERDAQKLTRTEAVLRKQAEAERGRAEREKSIARLNEYVADINLAQQSLLAGNLGRAVQLVEKHQPKAGEPDLRGFEWRFLWQLCQGNEHAAFPATDGSAFAVAFSPGDELLAVAGQDKIRIWNASSRTLLTTLPHGARALAFSTNGKTLISSGFTGVRIWNTTDWSFTKRFDEFRGMISFSRDARFLATSSRDGVAIWDVEQWKEIQRFKEAFGRVAFSPDAQTVATDSRDGISLWDIPSAALKTVLKNSTNAVPGVGPWLRDAGPLVFSPDGKLILSPNSAVSERGDFPLRIWSVETGAEAGSMPDESDPPEHTSTIFSIAFSKDGKLLATGSWDHSIRIWDVATRTRLTILQGHRSEILTVAFSADGQSIVSGAKDGAIKMWPVRQQRATELISGNWSPLGFSKDSRFLTAVNRDGSVSRIDMVTQEAEPLLQLERSRHRFGVPVAVSHDLRTMAYATGEGRVQIWNAETREVTSTLDTGVDHVDMLALSPDGRTLVTGRRDRAMRLWDLRHNTNTVLNLESNRILFSPDGKTFASFQQTNGLQLWDVATRSVRKSLSLEVPMMQTGTFSPDGRVLAVAAVDNSVLLIDVATGRVIAVCAGHKQFVMSIAFSPDGRTLATSSDDSTTKLWNLATSQEMLTIHRVGGSLHALSFSPDGRLLVGAGSRFSQGGLRVYTAPLMSEIAKAR